MDGTTIAEAFKAPPGVGGRHELPEFRLVDAYRWNRVRGVGLYYPRTMDSYGRPGMKPAREALELAREDVATGRRRYAPRGSAYGPRFAAWGESQVRWVESTSAAGLRFVGYADEMAGLCHQGYYVDEFADDVARGVVYQLPSRGGRLVFAYGYADPWNDGAACLCFADDADSPEEAARYADAMAERMAESERAYQEASRAGAEHAEAVEEEESERGRVLSLIREVRRASRVLGAADFPAACETLRGQIRASLDRIHELRERRAELRETYRYCDGFAEAAGLESES